MRRAMAIGMAAALGLTVGATSASASGQGDLYKAHAKQVELRHVSGGWRLVLHQPATRLAGLSGPGWRMSNVVGGWKQAFPSGSAEAAVDIEGAPQSRDVALLRLSRPRYDRAARTVSFRAQPQASTSSRALAGIASRADAGISGKLGAASVLLDAGAPSNVLWVYFYGQQSTSYEQGDTAQVVIPMAIGTPTFTAQASWDNWTQTSNGTANMLTMWCAGPTNGQSQNDAGNWCSGQAVVTVDAPTDQPLLVQVTPYGGDGLFAGDLGAQASWAGGPVQTIIVQQTPTTLTLQPGS
jgi:hypothetical protein